MKTGTGLVVHRILKFLLFSNKVNGDKEKISMEVADILKLFAFQVP